MRHTTDTVEEHDEVRLRRLEREERSEGADERQHTGCPPPGLSRLAQQRLRHRPSRERGRRRADKLQIS
eukprot:scaffold2723_cov108-Isochrysis_galbana.AAC.17